MRVLDGVWYGYYLEESIGNPSVRANHFLLRTEFQTKGTWLLGEMTDEKSVIERSLRAEYDMVRHRLDEKQRAGYEAVLKRDPNAQVISRLPETSRVRGRVNGREVTFLKEYQGIYRIEYVVLNDRRTVYENARHFVEYEGELDANSDAIEGRWIIRPPGLFGRFKPPAGMGRFRLDRR